MLKIKTLFLFVAVCAVVLRKVNALSEEEEKEIHQIMMPAFVECSEQLSMNLDDFIPAKKNKDVGGVDSCLLECVFKKTGVIDDEGMFVAEKYAENMKKILKKEGDSDKIEESAKNCAPVNDSDADDKCAKSKALFTCLMEQKDLLHL